MAFHLESFFVHSRAQGDGHVSFACIWSKKGPAPLLYVTDSEAAFVELLGGRVGAQVNSPTLTDLSWKVLSESLFWNAEFIFPEKHS